MVRAKRLTISRPVRQKIVIKNGRPARAKPTPGTVQASEIRARCNKLTDTQRQQLRDQGMRLFYGPNPNADGQNLI
jgi:hypothetical protein